MFENRVMRIIFGPKRDKITGEWKRLQNNELNDVYFLSNIISLCKLRRMRWGSSSTYGGQERCI